MPEANKYRPSIEPGARYLAASERSNSFIRKPWPLLPLLEREMHGSGAGMRGNRGIDRRYFLWSGVALAVPPVGSARVKDETVYRFVTRECDVRMSVDFYDRYSSDGFWFDERRTDRRYCLSAAGEEGHNCLTNFSGSIAVARYSIQSRSTSPNLLVLREHVRTIDRDSRLDERPPFDRMLELKGGLASDIQAFGYEPDASSAAKAAAQPHEPWCLLRQDLYLDRASVPFLIVHWKHTLSAIRILDLIPGDQTRLVGKRGTEEAR